MQRRTLLKTTALFALSAAIPTTLTACNPQANQQPAATTKPLTIGISGWPGWGAHYIAQAKGFYKEAGLNIDIKTFSSFSDINTALLAGQLDMGYIGGADIMVLNQKGGNLKTVMLTDYSNGADGLVGRNITTLADLKGKKIAMEDTPYNAVFLNQALKKANLTEKDVQIVAMTTDAAATAIITGNVDAAVIYQPFLKKTVDEGKCNILFTTEGTNIIPNILAANAKVMSDRKEDLVAYLKAYAKAMELYRNNQADVMPIVAKEVGAPPEEVVGMLKGIRTFTLKEHLEGPLNPSSDLSIYKSFEVMHGVLSAQGKLPATLDMKSLFDEVPLRAAIG
jgi:NitT/TauT family transport system substrate-binding protein